MKLSGPKKDLSIASQAVEKMKATKSYDEFLENWENYLFRIERAWQVTERILQSQKGFQQWNRPYKRLRKKDSLLVFLRHARNAEMHRASDTLNKPLNLVVKDKNGRDFTLDSISTRFKNGALEINLNTSDILLDLDISVEPTDPKVVRFKDRGDWYNPPSEHLNNKINDAHPAALAELGLSFYRAYIAEAENWLQKSVPNGNK